MFRPARFATLDPIQVIWIIKMNLKNLTIITIKLTGKVYWKSEINQSGQVAISKDLIIWSTLLNFVYTKVNWSLGRFIFKTPVYTTTWETRIWKSIFHKCKRTIDYAWIWFHNSPDISDTMLKPSSSVNEAITSISNF